MLHFMALLVAATTAGCSDGDPGQQQSPAGSAASGGGGGASGTPAGGGGGSSGGGGSAAIGGGGAGGAGGATGTSGGGGASGASGTSGAGGGSGGSGAGGAGGASGAGQGGDGPDAGTAGTGGGTRPDVVSFGPNVRVNDDTGRASQVEVAIAVGKDGVLLAGWVDGRSGTRCAYSVSKDGGENWGENFTVATNGSGITGDTVVGADHEGNLFAVCQDYGTSRIRLARSSDAGDTWSDFADVQSAPDKPWIAGVRDGTLFLTWLGNPGGYKRSLDHGRTWESVISLGNIVHGTAIAPSTTGIVHVPHNQGSSLRYRRSTDWGETLEAGRTLSEMGSSCYGCDPRHHPIVGAATDPTGEIVAITWASTMSGGDGDDDVWVLVSQDGGDTWSDRLRANDNEQRSRQFQSWVAVDPFGRVHVIWTDFRHGGDNAVYYTSLTDPEEGFEPNIEVTDGRGDPASFMGDYKAIAIDGEDVIAIWSDDRNGDSDIYFARAVGAAAGP